MVEIWRITNKITLRKLMNKIFVILQFFFSSTFLIAQSPKIYINEFLASNVSTNPDIVDFGDFSDWIELYNDENSDVNIGSFYITDDFTQPMKWQIPDNTVVPAKGFYLLWADDYNDIPGKDYVREWWPYNIGYTTQWCHTNFKLDKDGDKIGLYDNNGNPVDSLIFNKQETDISFGRQPDGSNNFYFFGEPTPLTSNNTPAVSLISYAADVIFSNQAGFYPDPIQVELSASNGIGVIRYTTDGSEPSSLSLTYSEPIIINENTMLRARVFESGKIPGPVSTNSYFINEVRNLPAVSIVTDNSYLMGRELGIYRNTLKEREIPISFEYFPLTENASSLSLNAGMRIGGENIYRFAQKPLNIYARGHYGSSKIVYNIFDDLPFVEYKRLYLRNGGDDWPNTMFRDGLMVSILKGQISNSMQNFKPSVLYLNNSYWGIYNLREKLDEQYFLLHYKVDPADLDHLESNNGVISGDSSEFIALLDFASSNDLSHTDNFEYIKSKIDLHNFMDFIIIQDYLANSSWGHNREVWRDNRNEKLWRWVLVDMDRGFNKSRTATNQLNDIYNNFRLFREFCDNKQFVDEFVQRYSDHVDKIFDTSRVNYIIDSLKTTLEGEMPVHISKWKTYIDSLSIDEWGQTAGIQSISSWKTKIQELRDFANQRAVYALQYLSEHFNLSDRSKLEINSSLNNQGKVTINGAMEDIGMDHHYFNNIPIEIEVYPPPGYKLKQWKEIKSSSRDDLIPAGASWKYRDEGTTAAAGWNTTGFDDSSWKSGYAQLGYGDGDENTIISYGANAQDKYITAYFRHTFTINDLAAIDNLTLNLLRDDGAMVYLNGTEVVRSNMPAGEISFGTPASVAIGPGDESTFYSYDIDESLLTVGTNVLAVELHQSNATSSDMSFDLSLYTTLIDSTKQEIFISSENKISYSLTGNAQLFAEFEEIGSNIVPSIVNTSLNLTADNSPYYVTSDVQVETGSILSVEPGVEILFAKGKSMYISGKLELTGNIDSPVSLKPYYPTDTWGAICFNNSAENSFLTYVNIIGASNGNDPQNFFAAVSALNSTVVIDHVNFYDCSLPISSQWSDMLIDNCKFEKITKAGDYINCNGGNITIRNSIFEGNQIADMDAIDLGFNTDSTIISNNIIRNFSGDNTDGIDLGDGSSNVIIENNLILNCRDKGISVGQGSDVVVKHNSIAGSNMGIGIKDSLSYAYIINNTFYKNNIAVACYEKTPNRGGGMADIVNSILANSGESSIFADELSEISIRYSISNTDSLEGTGNIYGDPWLINPDDANFFLQAYSVAIDAGDPESENDSDGSPSDIGAHTYRGSVATQIVINEINYNSPLDFNSEDWIELYNNAQSDVDISGWVFMDETHKASYVIDIGSLLASGSYLVLCRDINMFSKQFPGIDNYYGNLKSGLSGSGESLFLYTQNGYLADSVTYNDIFPWPTDADGNGASLELINPTLDNALGSNWKASAGHGTPGKVNSSFAQNIENNPDKEIPDNFALRQNYPNPFNPETIIQYELPVDAHVEINIFDSSGRRIKSIRSGSDKAGIHKAIWDGTNSSGQKVASGIYFISMQANKYHKVHKALLLK